VEHRRNQEECGNQQQVLSTISLDISQEKEEKTEKEDVA
jgi:hypothetical protein